MKKESLSDALGQVGDDLILEAARKRKKRRSGWIVVAAVAACVCLMVGLAVPAFWKDGSASLGREVNFLKYGSAEPKAIRTVVYPECAPAPQDESLDWESYLQVNALWQEDRDAAAAANNASNQFVDAFAQATAPTFLMGAEGENRVYSPVNVYMALSMLAELTQGQSRGQIMALLGAEDMQSLRIRAQNVWRANYSDDGVLTSVLANSLWLDESISYNPETLDILSEQYYASSYQGSMGSKEYNELLQAWLKEQTGGLLDEQAENAELSGNCVLALASTVYFQGRWADVFSEEKTAEDVFYTPNGEKTADFMNQTLTNDIIYWGENYTAVKKSMTTGGGMWLILPDEGVSVDELLEEGEAMEMVCSTNWSKKKNITIHLSLPKFDIVSQTELSQNLQALGVTDVFQDTLSDFSPITEEYTNLVLSEVQHAARVTVDEEGGEAAAYTLMLVTPTSAPEPELEEISFTLDRPFLFVLTGVSDQPLFVGVVNDPS